MARVIGQTVIHWPTTSPVDHFADFAAIGFPSAATFSTFFSLFRPSLAFLGRAHEWNRKVQ